MNTRVIPQFVGVLALALAGCGESGVEISKAELGRQWPLTVDSGLVDCESGQVVVFKANGTSYALNSNASSRGYPEIDPILRDNPAVPGTKIPTTTIMLLGYQSCS